MDGRQTAKGILRLCADTALRLGLGAMFLYSAWGKIQDPGMFQTMVDNYRMLPAGVTALFAVTMSTAELLVGAMFIFSKWTREAAFATAVMLAMFIVALTQAQIRGLDISCGCFSESEKNPHEVLHALVRDVLLIVPTAWLLIKGQRRWIADFRRIWYTVRQ
jgi:uncharacterized membrane protein YphA (DoxX/SURF4 family)